MAWHLSFLAPWHRVISRHHKETHLRYIHLVSIIVNLKILTLRLLQGSNSAHTSTTMPYGGFPGGGQPPMWPPPWGLASGGSLMPWGPPTGGGYWPSPPWHLTLPLQPGPGQWVPQQLWGPPANQLVLSLEQQEGQVRYDISVSMNQLVLSFARTGNFKMLTLTMGLHRSSQH
jgi:hypothetical protein